MENILIRKQKIFQLSKKRKIFQLEKGKYPSNQRKENIPIRIWKIFPIVACKLRNGRTTTRRTRRKQKYKTARVSSRSKKHCDPCKCILLSYFLSYSLHIYEVRIQGNNLGKAPFVQHVTNTFDRLFYTAVQFG